MKFSELEGNVVKLIDEATAVKQAASAPAADDPAIEALNSKVLVALDVLKGPSAPPAPADLPPGTHIDPVTGVHVDSTTGAPVDPNAH